MRKSRTNAGLEYLYVDLLYICTCSCQTFMNIGESSLLYGNVVVTLVTNIFDEEVSLNFV
jgi:hypothetical protein